jgi:myo-inositol-1-phosphate synthase
MLEPVGMVTERSPIARLDLVPLDNLVPLGFDVCRRPLTGSAGELVQSGILDQDLVTSASGEASAYEARVRPGVLDGAEVGVADLEPESARLGSLAPREQVAYLQGELERWTREHELERIVVVNLASTEAFAERRVGWESLGALEAELDRGVQQPASVTYAYAALDAGHPHVNFTPSPGASPPALRELARERGVPHCGNDGKTGETLLKTVLAPLFVARNLRVLAWQGYNMLGNRDGEVLADPLHKESKLRNKNEALRAILGDDQTHTHVGIDYVPSLQDWKTAFDLIHFEGFLGARMTLSFTWTGSDSALAAPLVIDLARLTEYSARRGEAGEMAHTASFFKSPIAGARNRLRSSTRTPRSRRARRTSTSRPAAGHPCRHCASSRASVASRIAATTARRARP